MIIAVRNGIAAAPYSYRFVVGNMLILVGIISEERSLPVGNIIVRAVARLAVCTVRAIDQPLNVSVGHSAVGQFTDERMLRSHSIKKRLPLSTAVKLRELIVGVEFAVRNNLTAALIGSMNRTVQLVELCLILRQHSVHDGISRVVSDLTLSFLTHSHHLFSVWSVAGYDFIPR